MPPVTTKSERSSITKGIYSSKTECTTSFPSPLVTNITTDITEITAVKMSLLRFFSQKCSATSGAMAMVSSMMANGMTIHSST